MPQAAEERFLVTGALGCIGAWVVRLLLREAVPTAVFDIAGDPHRLKLILTGEELGRVDFLTGDITDLAAVERALGESGATHLVHLAGLQVPFCKADPPLGARVNVVGTVNVFEAARRAGRPGLAYASSVAVFGRSEEYSVGALPDDAAQKPHTHYGVFKRTNEGTAGIYWEDNGLASIGLRPFAVYGPGRDQGLTSAPTRAMLAAAAGQPFHIPYGGRGAYQYAEDAARAFIRAARAAREGAHVFNLRGSAVEMREIVGTIEAAEPSARGRITFDDKPLPFPEDLDDAALQAALGPLEATPLERGVRSTIALFKQALAEGRLSEPPLT